MEDIPNRTEYKQPSIDISCMQLQYKGMLLMEHQAILNSRFTDLIKNIQITHDEFIQRYYEYCEESLVTAERHSSIFFSQYHKYGKRMSDIPRENRDRLNQELSQEMKRIYNFVVLEKEGTI